VLLPILLLVLVGALLLVGALFIHPAPGRSPDVAIGSWEIVIPRDARFGVAQAQAWFESLKPLFTPGATASIELCNHSRRLCLRLTAPHSWEQVLRGQTAAWFPEARLQPVAEQSSTLPVAIQVMATTKPEILPIRLGAETEIDPLLGLIGALTHAPNDCGFRLAWRAEPREWRRWSRDALLALSTGRRVLPRRWPTWLRVGVDLALSVYADAFSVKPSEASKATVDVASTKMSAPVFEAHLALWATGPTSEAAQHQVQQLAAYLTQSLHDPIANTLAPVGAPMVSRPHQPDRAIGPAWRVYTSAELASLVHLPNSVHPLVPTETGRLVPPSTELLNGGDRRDAHLTWLGEALTRERPEPFGLQAEERRLHLYVVGKTGTGKSTFLTNIAHQDLERGHGLGLIDPHGDLAERVLALVPPSRHHDVLYFNAADATYPVGFNPLATRTLAERPLIASGVVGVFKKLYGDSWGPRLEHFLRNAVLALLESPSPSLLLLPRLLNDKAYRQHLLIYVRDPLLRTFFLEEYERYDPRWRAEAISPILNKVGQFLSSPVVRHIVGQSGSGFNLRELMDRRGIFIANLASGRIGEDNCSLLGGLLVTAFQLAAMSRANIPEGERQDFYLLVDEFQHFANDAFGTILSEARKYRLALTLSHQYLDQVPPTISDAVFGNVGSLAAFRVGAGDVARLGREFAPAFDGQDLVHLPNYHFCARLARPSGSLPAFSARTIPAPSGINDPQTLIDLSRRRWARPRSEVAAEIERTWLGGNPA